MKMGQDSVREHLRQIGASDRIVDGGLKGLVDAWDAVVNSVARGYSLDIDSYLNDLDTRQLLEEVLSASPESEKQYYLERVDRADRLMKKSVKPVGRCLWGEAVARKEAWSPGRNWWYFSVPIRPGKELLEDLKNRS
jgi:hypothetical protein